MLPGVLTQDLVVPVGCVLPYAGSIAVTDGHKKAIDQIRANLASTGWLFCDGSPQSKKKHLLLWGVIGYAFGGSGDNFNLPDLRGRFIRGVDGGAKNDPSAAGRKVQGYSGNTGDQVGSLQLDAYQGHEHDYKAAESPTSIMAGEGAPVLVYGPSLNSEKTTGQEEGGDGTPRTDKETRPLNLYLNFIIRYR